MWRLRALLARSSRQDDRGIPIGVHPLADTPLERAISPILQPDGLVTVAEAAALLGRSTSCIRDWITAGELTPASPRGRVLLRSSDVRNLRDRLPRSKPTLRLVWVNPDL
mgnify:CR=1 FL=1